MKRLHISNLYKIGLRYPFSVLTLAFLGAVISFYFATKLHVETDFSALLPPETESVRNLNELKSHFGSMGHLFATVESEDPALAEKFADEFVSRLEALPTVRFVDYRRPVDFFEKRKWLFVDKEDLQEMESRVDRALDLEKEGVSPVFSDLMDFAEEQDRPDLTFEDIKKKYEDRMGKETKEISSDEEEKFLIVRVKAKQGSEDFEANRALVASIRKIEGELKQKQEYQKRVEVGYAGSYLTTIEGVDLINKEMAWVSAIVTAVLLLIMLVYFRRPAGAFVVGIPLAFGILWTGGFVYLFLGRVNIITAFAVSILAGLGSDYGIYLLSRYVHERERGVDFLEACRLAFFQTGRGTFAAVLTTMGAFAALIFSDFSVFVEFGIVGCLGLFLNFLAMILMMPSFLQLSEKYHRNPLFSWLGGWTHRPEKEYSWVSSFVTKIFSVRGAWVGIALTLALCGLASLSLPQESKIYFEDGEMDFSEIPSNKLYNRISDTLGASLHPTILLFKDPFSESKTVTELNRLLDEKPKDSLVYEKVLGLSTFYPKDQGEKREILKRLNEKYVKPRYVNEGQKRKFINSARDALAAGEVTRQDLPEEVRRMFVSPKDPNVFAVYVFPAISRMDSDGMARYREGILEAKREIGNNFTPVDESFISFDLINLVKKEAPRGLILVLIFLSGVLFLTIRNFKRSLLILGNLIAGLLLLSGVLYLAGIRLNILNIAVFPIILGTGIDCFIHLSHRYDETRDLNYTIRSEVPAIIISNITSIVGFGGLIFTSSVGLRSIGWVSVLGLIIITLLGTLVFTRMLSIPSLGRIKVPQVDQKAVEA